jgi:hypothetical protein
MTNYGPIQNYAFQIRFDVAPPAREDFCKGREKALRGRLDYWQSANDKRITTWGEPTFSKERPADFPVSDDGVPPSPQQVLIEMASEETYPLSANEWYATLECNARDIG